MQPIRSDAPRRFPRGGLGLARITSAALIAASQAGAASGDFAFESQARVLLANAETAAAGDMNGDGRADLVVRGTTGNGIGIALSNGAGGFGAVGWITQLAPMSVAVTDVDGDGHADILATILSPSSLVILRNRGHARGFDAPVFVATLQQASMLATGDVDGDGDADAIVMNWGIGGAAVLFNDGNGVFAPVDLIWDVGWDRTGLTLIDMDEDADLDLVVLDRSARRVVTRLNVGAGRFAAAVSIPADPSAFELAAGDVDGDQLADVVTANAGRPYVSILRNEGGGVLSGPRSVRAGADGRAILVADLDADGAGDIVVGDMTGLLTVLRSRYRGQFAKAQRYRVGSMPYGFEAADVHGDGKLDIVCPCTSPLATSILTGAGDGTFVALPFFEAGKGVGASVLLDADLDGDLDLAAITTAPDGLSLLRNRGDGTYETPVFLGVGSYPRGVVAGDLDLDGDTDLVVLDTGSDEVSVFVNLGGGNFAPRTNFPAGWNPTAIALGDVNGDAALDVVLANGSQTVTFLLQAGAASFAPPHSVPLGDTAWSIDLCDVDGDLDLDIVTGNAGVRVLLNLGNEIWSGPVVHAQVYQVGAVTHADLDQDGRTDLVATYPWANSIGVIRNSGGGVFAPEVVHDAGHAPVLVGVEDVDGDRYPDLLVTNTGSRDVSVYTNRGDGTFEPEVRVAAEGTWTSAGDVDADGDVDLVTSDDVRGVVVVQRNTRASGNAFCVGDGSGVACPCANSSLHGEASGCVNSTGQGGHLAASGQARIHADGLALTCTRVPSSIVVFMQSPSVWGSGHGVPFADGLRCIGSPYRRLGVRSVVGGTASVPSAAEGPLSVRGGVHVPGLMYYQAWFRDNARFCTWARSNLTNGLTVRWIP